MAGRIVYLSDVPSPGRYALFSDQPDVMNVSQAAALLGVSAKTIRREVSRGTLRCAHVGTRILISKTALLEYIGEEIA